VNQTTDPFRAVVVGCHWGETLAAAVADCEAADLIAVADRDEAAAEETARDHDVPAYGDHAALLAAETPDAALVAVPPAAHAPVTEAFLREGVDVYLEKPAGEIADPEAVLDLQAVADEHGATLMPGYSQRFQPYVAEALAAVRDGAIGPVTSVAARRQADWSPDPPAAPSWGIHDYDACCALTGAPPDAIRAFSPTLGGDPDPATVEVVVEHENGAISRCATATGAQTFGVELRVHGAEGEIVASRADQRTTVHTPGAEWSVTHEEAPPFQAQAVDAFFEALAAGEAPPVTAAAVVGGRRVEAAVYEQLGIDQ
jgi:predicted dehydrogenase